MPVADVRFHQIVIPVIVAAAALVWWLGSLLCVWVASRRSK
jgi:hypothetical protein